MRWVWKVLAALVVFVLLMVGLVELMFVLNCPEPPDFETDSATVEVLTAQGINRIGNSWYRQNDVGLWEAYVAGEPYQRGLTLGALAKQQVRDQEEHFVAQIKRLVPNSWFLSTLRHGVAFFNRNLNHHVPYEYQREIWGISRAFDAKNDWIGPPYARVMNYHAAHDIGHALQDLSIVGCTSFAAWNGASADSGLIIGRNFDFYMGDDFARDKMVLFVRPDSGFAFASVTWAAFMGVVSGMNEHGLTVTLNAARSAVPTGSKTPISILAREILQYAGTIDQAIAIAKRRETFVSESILIGSGADGLAVIIEKSPDRLDVFRADGNRLVCANHYQTAAFVADSSNVANIRESDSHYRFDRMVELLDSLGPMGPVQSAYALRDRRAEGGVDIGLGNPRSINQLIAHHAVIFQPEKRLMWVSTAPYQMGKMLCYNLGEIFGSTHPTINPNQGFYVDSLTLDADPFLATTAFSAFDHFRFKRQQILGYTLLGNPIEWNEMEEQKFIASNPTAYMTYQLLGDLYAKQGQKTKAAQYYQRSLQLAVASLAEKRSIEAKLKDCQQP